ncbi:hypothetical protein [Mesorhizobium sp. CN2-181]|uniref:hypothetical protein n=1 Tax=Mesorhizobium yinganensis TaxID=3157707 RepID=UPI0032B76109
MDSLRSHVTHACSDADGAMGSGRCDELPKDCTIARLREIQRPPVLHEFDVSGIAAVMTVRTGPAAGRSGLAA